MWVFYLISLPLTLGMVILTLKYFAAPEVPKYVSITVGYTWFCSIAVIVLVPADIWTTTIGHDNGGISFFWSWSYWSTFLLTWLAVPLIQGYEDAGDFTMMDRLKTSIHVNLVFYLIVGSIGLFGLILLITLHKDWFVSSLGTSFSSFCVVFLLLKGVWILSGCFRSCFRSIASKQLVVESLIVEKVSLLIIMEAACLIPYQYDVRIRRWIFFVP